MRTCIFNRARLMQIQAKAPAFDDFYRMLSQAKVTASPAEIHGLLCGLICVGPKLNGCFWIDVLLKRLGNKSDLMLGPRSAVVDLYDAACKQLSGLQSFQLLLPEEHHNLAERAKALGLWCEAFLYGLGLLGSSFLTQETSDAVHNALSCITDIARLDVGKRKVTSLDSLAYEQAIEFITQSIPLIYEELARCPSAYSAGSMYLH